MAKKRKSKAKFNNPYHVPNEKAEEIRGLVNQDLISRASIEYRNWIASIDTKKKDPELLRVKEAISSIRKNIKEDSEYQRLEEEFAKKKEELIDEELARLEEEQKNVVQPYSEDIKSFCGLFRICMDELGKRRDGGLLKL